MKNSKLLKKIIHFSPVYSIFLIAAFIVVFPGNSTAQTTISGSFLYGGLTRTYRIYIPAIYNPAVPVPLVLNLHGYTSNNIQQEAYGNFKTIADTANFIIVHPNGTMDGNGNLFWNCFGASSVDDVGFLSALIDTVSASYNIDPNRVYSTGMSNGGIMSYHLACSLNDRIAAIASVTGTMSPSMKNSCNPQHPTPVLEIHGTADATVAYNGNTSFVPIDSLVKYWAIFNNCSLSPSVTTLPNINTTDGCTAERHVFSGGDMGSSVELFKIIGGGHSWPGAPINLNVTNMDFSASVEIWRFFRNYKLNVLTGEPPAMANNPSSLTIFPNPSSGIFCFSAGHETFSTEGGQIQIFNVLGNPVYTENIPGTYSAGRYETFTIDLSVQPDGFYMISFSSGIIKKRVKILKTSTF